MSLASRGWVFALIILLGGTTAHALTINTTFDSTVTSLGNSAQWISAWNYAAGQFQVQYSDPITINITFKAGGGLGSSSTNLQYIGGTDDYAAMKAALIADSKTTNDATAYANLPNSDPTGGRTFIASLAEAKALGLRAANDPTTDGIITLGSGNTYAFDPNNRAVAGAYDFIGVAEHEISEVMGRIGILGETLGTGTPLEDSIDLFGYSSPHNLNLNPNQQGVYFSINGGVTSLRVYNNHSNGGDDKDWASGQVPANDAFNAFGTPGAKEDMSLADMQTMDVIGYDLVPLHGAKGDMNNDGIVNNFDISPFELALTNPSAYLSAYPSMTDAERVYRGDINSDSAFDNFDIGPFEILLATGHYPAAPVPEPDTLALLVMGGIGLVAVMRRRRS